MTEDDQRFEILETLGEGGFGTVYRARKLGPEGFSKEVALKVLHSDVQMMDEVARRLRDEARLLGLLRHRAIVHTDGLVYLNGCWTVVMEYVEGVDLSAIMAQGPVPPRPALELISEVASALHVAHHSLGPDGRQLKLLHRDIKPSNIQLTPHGEVKVLDFGIARAEFDAREAKTGSLAFGSLPYMSPERLDFLDSSSGDVYSLGVVLFELLSGEPFGKTSAVRGRHELKLLPALAELREARGIDLRVVALLEKAMAWDPSARPDARALERWATMLAGELDGEPLRFWAEGRVKAASGVQPPRTPAASTLLVPASREGDDVTSWEATPVPQTAARERTPRKPLTPSLSEIVQLPQGALDILRDTEFADTSVPRAAPKRRAWMVAPLFVALVGTGAIAALKLGTTASTPGTILPAQREPATSDSNELQADQDDNVRLPAHTLAGQDMPTEAHLPETTRTDAPVDEQGLAVAAPAEDAPVRRPLVASTPQASPTKESQPRAPLPAPSQASVQLRGDALRAWLIDHQGSERLLPGDAPAGVHQIKVLFPGGTAPLVVGTLNVPDSGSVTIECEGTFETCEVK